MTGSRCQRGCRDCPSLPRAKSTRCVESKGKSKNAEPSRRLWASPAGISPLGNSFNLKGVDLSANILNSGRCLGHKARRGVESGNIVTKDM